MKFESVYFVIYYFFWWVLATACLKYSYKAPVRQGYISGSILEKKLASSKAHKKLHTI